MKPSDLLASLESKMALGNYSLDTIKAYRASCRNFFAFVLSDPDVKKMPAAKRIEAYLTHRVQDDDISASTQNVEFNALIYLHRHVLNIDVQGINSLRARPKLRVPPILTPEQVNILLLSLPADTQLIARILYGTGMRINECLRLRIKDVDFHNNKLIIHQAKGDKERILPMPEVLRDDIRRQYNKSINLWRADHIGGYGVHLPRALEKKYKSYWLSKEWYWLFPAADLSIDPRTKRKQRHHVKDYTVQKAFADVRACQNLPVYATPHSLRHAFATHLAQNMMEQGFPREMIEAQLIEYLGHASKETLKFYIHLTAPKSAVFRLPIELLLSALPSGDEVPVRVGQGRGRT